MYFLQAIKQINPMSAGFGSKAYENLLAVLREKLRQRCLYIQRSHFYEHLTVAFLRTFNSRFLRTFNSRILRTSNSHIL